MKGEPPPQFSWWRDGKTFFLMLFNLIVLLFCSFSICFDFSFYDRPIPKQLEGVTVLGWQGLLKVLDLAMLAVFGC